MADSATRGEAARGLADVVAASTALSDIDGRAGRLSFRGYDIHDLAGRASFEEVVHLLQRGSLPTSSQLDELRTGLTGARALGPTVRTVLPELAAKCGPMEALRTLVSASAADDPDGTSIEPEAETRKAVRLVGQQAALVAAYHAARQRADSGGSGGSAGSSGTAAGELPEPDAGLGLAGALLSQLTGRRPSESQVAAFDECLVLHADHTMNASTFAARVCAATLSDMHSAVTAAIGTLRGPLHGGANEAVMHLLEEIGSLDAVPAAVRERLGRGEKIPGFGHRVYRTEDPRATHLRALSQRMSAEAGDTTYSDMSLAMEREVLKAKELYPNVDFFAASTYHALGIPTDLFTAVFSVSRMAGWTAHVMEQHADNRLIRPASEYVGERDRSWVPLGER